MEIHKHLIFRAYLGGLINKVHHFLIVTIQEIHLEAFHAHIRIMLHDILHITGESPITRPKDNSDILELTVIHQFLKIDLRYYLHHVRLQVHGPALIQDYVLDAMLGGEVDIIFIGGIIDSGTEIHTV